LRSQVIRSVVGGSALLAGVGVLIGLLGAAYGTGLLTGMLYGIEPWDLASFAGSVAVFATAVVVASLVPARRAASINPVNALRSE
jgi:ABC-type antimicrobial peptide transport system permease subunit